MDDSAERKNAQHTGTGTEQQGTTNTGHRGSEGNESTEHKDTEHSSAEPSDPGSNNAQHKAPGSPVPPDCHQGSYVPSKDYVAAGLLAIFLGSLGIHKFYLGYNSTGFIMLAVTVVGSAFTLGVAGGVMGVIGIIEGIMYLTQGQQRFDRTYVQNRREWF